ncbi:glyoxalase [Paenibacillus swuensis]|uniref:Glyoxalase n=1 Tax=Paenibacillus swuensis TaxID=1178515 RepID=A0A172TGZ1_9BACL|nr:VOC family protein [Paenibacillus swuensis]ANE46315.1 glyoxalase [Paenibacillus swuensis]
MSYAFIGLDHVQLAAPEGSESVAREFYGKVLGWTEIPKPANLLKRGGVWFQCGFHQLHIGIQTDFVPAIKAHPAFQVKHLETLKATLTQQGISVTEDYERQDEGVSRFYLHDPFGNRLEFMERHYVN